MGGGNGPGYTMGLVALPDDHADIRNLKASFAQDVSVMALWANNKQGTVPISVSPDGATLKFADGSTVAALKARTVLGSAKVDRTNFLAKFGGPFVVQPGSMIDGKFVFVPPGLDLTRLQSVTIVIDGQERVVPGRIFTADEKSAGLKRSGGGGGGGDATNP
jgi:hypothetical protein